jgi:hypothetical protein
MNLIINIFIEYNVVEMQEARIQVNALVQNV